MLRATITSDLDFYFPITIDETLQVEPIDAITPPYRLSITTYDIPKSEIRIWKETYSYFDYNDTIDLLKQKGIIRWVYTFRGESRFSIADEFLSKAIIDCWNVFGIIDEITILTLKYLRRSSKEERNRMRYFHGEEMSDEIFRSFYNYRHLSINTHKKKDFIERIEREVKELSLKANEEIEEIKMRHSDTIKKYHFPLNSLIQLVYPEYLQKSHNK